MSTSPARVNGQLAPTDLRARRAAAQAEKVAEQRREYEVELTKALPELDRLIASDNPADWRSALAALNSAARKFDKAGGQHPMIQARLGELALRDNRPQKAIEFVAAFTQSRDELPPAHIGCWLVLAQAHLRQAGFQPRYDNDAMSMDRLLLFGVPIDSDEVVPKLNEVQKDHVQQALVISDWVAGEAHGLGLAQARAAMICAQALAMKADYHQSVDSYNFALYAVRRDPTSEGAADPHARERDDIYRQRAHVQRIWDIQRYAIEYVLFREADTLRRNRQFEKAIAAYRKCIEAADNTMLKLLEAQLSTDLGALPATQEATRQSTRRTGSRRDLSEIDGKPQPDESPYTAASKFHIGLCLIKLGEHRDAVRWLQKFIDSDPGNIEGKSLGLFRGEAMLELGRLVLEQELDLKAAEQHFVQLDEWIVKARAENEAWDFTALLPGISKAAKPLTDGPKQEKFTDFWGNVKKTPIQPGMIVERKTTPWYLDDLEEHCAKLIGFIRFANGDKEGALRHWERITRLDPTISRQGDLASNPNDFHRLKFGIETGYLVAYPDELASFNDRARNVVMLVEFAYVTGQFTRAAKIADQALAGRFGKLNADQAAYFHFVAGMIAYRSGAGSSDRAVREAMAHFESAFAVKSETVTKYRAAYAYAMAARLVRDMELRDRGWSVLIELANASARNTYTQKARMTVALDLLQTGHKEEALRWLKARFKPTDGAMYALAQRLIENDGILIKQ